METKTLPIEECELKFNDDEWAVEGYATVWGSVDKIGDTIDRGAFTESIQKSLPLMRFEHLRFITPGKWTEATEDDRGLRVKGFLTRDHSWAKDLRASLRHGTVRGLSIGFGPQVTKSVSTGRLIQKGWLKEVSFTADPMEPNAQVESWKSEIGALESLSDFEAFLRESGVFSKSMATAFIGHLKGVLLSESGEAREEIERITKADIDRIESLAMKTRLSLLNHIRKMS